MRKINNFKSVITEEKLKNLTDKILKPLIFIDRSLNLMVLPSKGRIKTVLLEPGFVREIKAQVWNIAVV